MANPLWSPLGKFSTWLRARKKVLHSSPVPWPLDKQGGRLQT